MRSSQAADPSLNDAIWRFGGRAAMQLAGALARSALGERANAIVAGGRLLDTLIWRFEAARWKRLAGPGRTSSRPRLRSSGFEAELLDLARQRVAPQPRRCAASMRRPPVCASARRISAVSNSRASGSATPASPRASERATSRSSAGRQSGSPSRPQRARAPRALPAAGPSRRPWPGAITVIQWQTFSSWRTLPGHSSAARNLSAASVRRLRLDAQVARALREEMAREQRDVLAPLAQRRQPQADHVQAVERSSRNRPCRTRASRSWCVAAITRTFAASGVWPPTR